MNTTEFAQELDTTPRNARKFLRHITPKDEQPGKGSRWELPNGKRDITRLKKQFAEWTAANAKETDEVADAEVEDEVDTDS